jgi:2',3'-cyclic-nucleotide 2'-phosphodiesterase (5'-nucleotidase family)
LLNCSIIQTQHIKLLFLDSDYAESGAKVVQKYGSAKYSCRFVLSCGENCRFRYKVLILTAAITSNAMRKIISLSIVAVLFQCLLSCTAGKHLVSADAGNFKVAAMDNRQGAAAVREILERGAAAVDSIKRPVIGEASMPLEKYIPESPLMNFAADALLATARECTGQHIDIAITNKGGLRSNIAAGKITFGDIYNVFPFENTLALLTLDGEQLMQLCREIASVGGEAVSGMRLVITRGGELVSVTVDGKPVEAGRKYRIATSDYLSQGNDRMTALALGTERDVRSDITIRDLMVMYVKNLAAAGKPVAAECDGRITVQE